MAKSVYNFVSAPTESEVFKPDWAKDASHDIPFKDGECGEIKIELIAQTPIFVRNGHGKEIKDSSFSHFSIADNKQFFIPATSLKGVIRNTLEIFSFSRLKTKDDLFAFRKMEDKDNYAKQVQKSKSGWLYKEGKNWKIRECWSDNVEISSLSRYSRNWKELSAIEKYSLIKRKDGEYFPAYKVGSYRNVGFNGRVRSYKLKNKGGNKKLVVFGSIEGKKREYLFSKKDHAKIYNVPKYLIKNLNRIEEKLDEKESLWRFFKKKKIKEIPVFFVPSDDEKSVKHFGLSKLYKRTDTYSLFNLSPVKTYLKLGNKYKKDLATTMFGEIEEDDYNRNKGALKGRVYFSHALASGNPKEMDEQSYILSEPKASYYHFYIDNGKPFTHKNAKLAGFKKYPPHLDVKETNLIADDEDKEEKLITKIKPLEKDTVFHAKVCYHNLKKVEIGALISALTFHGKSNLYSHTLGAAKPFGYGKVNVRITSLSSDKIDAYLKAFEDEMNHHLSNTKQTKEWLNHIRIQQYLALSLDTITKEKNELLSYPKLDNGNNKNSRKNDFKNYISDKEPLWKP